MEMATTFAAYAPFPVYVPPNQYKSHTEYQPSGKPWHPPTQQDFIGFGVLLAVVLGVILLIDAKDKSSR